jgi:hypothetical protein
VTIPVLAVLGSPVAREFVGRRDGTKIRLHKMNYAYLIIANFCPKRQENSGELRISECLRIKTPVRKSDLL